MANPITVEGKDGQKFQFPEGTSQDVMKQALQKHYGAAAKPTGMDVVQSFFPNANERNQARQAEMWGSLDKFKQPTAFMAANANTATLGQFDNLNAAIGSTLSGNDFGSEKRQTQEQRQELRDEFPVSSTAGSISGFMAPGGLVAGAGKNVAARIPQASGQAAAYGQRLLGLGALGGVENALYEGTTGASNRGAEQQRDVGALEALEMAKDGGTDPIALAAGPVMSGVYRLGRGAITGNVTPQSVRPRSNEAPTTDELRATRDAAYAAVEATDAQYAPEAFADLAADLENTLAGEFADQVNNPKAMSMMKQIADRVGESPKVQELERIRRGIQKKVAGAIDPDERRLGSLMVNKIDEFMQSGEGLVGDVGQNVGELSKEARKAHGTLAKAEALESLFEEVVDHAGSVNSGGNFENVLRQKVRALLNNPKRSRGFTEAERDMMRQLVRGDDAQNFLRWAGRMSPRSGGLIGMLTLATSYVHPALAVPVVASAVARSAADKGVRRNFDSLSAFVRNGGRQMAQPPKNALAQLEYNGSNVPLAAMPPVNNALANGLENEDR